MAVARGEIVSAVQAMGWGEAEAAIMEVAQTVIMEAAEIVGQEPWPDWLWEVQMAVLEGAHQIVVRAAALEQSEAVAQDESGAAELAQVVQQPEDTATAELQNTATAELQNTATAELQDTATAELPNTATAELHDTATAELQNTLIVLWLGW